jgi:hypothetical protein
MNSKAQGTIEYLVVIGIVVVISLVVVGLLSNMAQNDESSFTSIKVAQRIGQNGISVTDSVESTSGNSVLVLKNVSSEPLTIQKISSVVNGAEVNPSVYNKQISSQSEVAFSLSNLNLACPCDGSTTRRKCTFRVEATTQTGMTQKATIEVVTDCTGSAVTPKNPDVAGLGSGTYADPWIVNSCLELQNVSQHVDGNFAMEADINCYNDTHTGGVLWNNGEGFDPIGAGYQFTGTFDGRGHKITGLYINRTAEQMIGLFQQPSGATIKNLGLEDGSITGNTYVGGFAGVLTNSSVIQNVYNKNSVNATYWYAGGIAGYMQSSSIIKDSYNAGDINVTAGQRTYVGGIASLAQQSTIQNCYNTGTISGTDSLAGITSAVFMATAKNSYSTGKVFGTGTGTNGLIAANIAGTVTNLWWYNQAGDGATSCGVTCNISTTDTNFYSSNQAVYKGTPAWDFTTTWKENSNTFPTYR